jgi:multidrug efflux pump subunit AcrA (membrane-fusion protein)
VANTQAQQDSFWTLEKCISYALEKNIQVRKGELSNQRFQYYADQAQTQLNYQGATYKRLNALYEKNLIAQADYDQALFNFGNSKASLSNAKSALARAKVQLAYATIYSPIAGIKIHACPQIIIINLGKIDTIERSRIVFGKVYIPVSDQYKEQFQKYLDKNFLV